LPALVLEDIDGIGTKTILLLRNANIDSVEKLTEMSISDLIKIKGIGEKSAKKFIVGARNLLNQTSGVQKEKTETLGVNTSIIKEIQSDIKDIHRQLDFFIRRLEKVENLVGIDSEPVAEISDDQFYRILKLSYNSLDKKLGGFVPISDLTEKIKDFIPWPTEKIHKNLYSLFLNYTVELQPGKSDRGTPLIQDGKKFVWFKLK